MMNTTQNARPVSAVRQPRFGLMAALVGSDHMVKCKDGVKRQFRVVARRTHPKVKAQAHCLTCGLSADTMDELLSSHPETGIMERQQEAHVYLYRAETDNKTVALLADE